MENNQETKTEIRIDTSINQDFNEISKWSGFLAIVGFIFLALLIVLSFTFLFISGSIPFGTQGMAFPRGLLFVVYLIFALIYFFPVYYLFRFSHHLRRAVRQSDEANLSVSMRYLKNFFVYTGVLTIIYLILMLIGVFMGIAIGRIF